MSDTARAAYGRLKQWAEEELRQRDDASKVRIHVGSATCENASGAPGIRAEFHKHIEASDRPDIVLRRAGCSGRCSREPIVTVIRPGEAPVTYHGVTVEQVHTIFTQHVLKGRPPQPPLVDVAPPTRYEFFLCRAERCAPKLETNMEELFRRKLRDSDIPPEQARVVAANCFGLCTPEAMGAAVHVLVRPDRVVYRVATEADVQEILDTHVRRGQIVERLRTHEPPLSQRFFQMYGEGAFFHRQSRIALRNSGVIDPESLVEYVHYDGFESLAKVLERDDPEWVIRQVTESKLRGRGGGGYPTGVKWANGRATPSEEKFIICNADEGDPGAFMDRSMLEGDPFSVIEGMMIGAYAIGANRGFFYVRAEYPLAIERIQTALAAMREHGLLGGSVLDSGWAFDCEIRLGAGAFVCGEETALINSIEGRRGQPNIRPPYPTTKGLWGRPTVINNVETFANVPAVLEYGPEWFARVGTERSGGTKVFALAGKVKHTGLVEVPMGTTLREVIFDIGGGVPGGKQLKAVQTGGPAGGCIPAEFLDTPVDFDTLMAVGSIMGSGGMIVMDETDCMVDIAKFFVAFSQDESCGKCTPCREGTMRMLEILERIAAGQGAMEDLDRLERLARLIHKSSLCGLGRAAPNPVLSTLRYFRRDYEVHVLEHRCPTGRCAIRAPGPPQEAPAQASDWKPTI